MRYLTLFRTHLWDASAAALAERARISTPSGKFVVAADETRGTLTVDRFEKLAHTDDFSSFSLPSLPRDRVLWWNADYVLYAARRAFPGFDYYLMLEYDVFVNCDVDAMLAECAARGVDLVAHDLKPLAAETYWFRFIVEFSQEPLWSFIPFVILSGRAIDTLLRARQAIATRLRAGEVHEWPQCESFIPTALLQQNNMVFAPLSDFVDTELMLIRPYISVRDPRLDRPKLIAHPVLGGRNYITAIVANTPTEALILPDGQLCPELQREDPDELQETLGALVERNPQTGALYLLPFTKPSHRAAAGVLVDLAHRKPALQSSHSEWSTGSTAAADAARAVCGILVPDYAFHTGGELDPWWQVDLGAEVLVEQIEIVNRAAVPYKFQKFSITTSSDGQSWAGQFVKSDDAPVSSDPAFPFIVLFPEPVRTRYVRIVQHGENVMHLRRIRIFGSPIAQPTTADDVAASPTDSLANLISDQAGFQVLTDPAGPRCGDKGYSRVNGRFVDLTALADRFRTDKGSIDGDRHLYSELYAACFESFRLQEFNLLELGLLRSPNALEETDPTHRQVERIPSVEMWLEFFPSASVYGFDLADFSACQRPRFTFLRGDLSQDADIERLARSVPTPRIIVDDASHASFHQQRAFLRLFPILAPGGFYVIEDLHYSPPFEPLLPPCRRMADIVQEFLDSGTLRLDFGAPEDAVALSQHIAHTFLHCSARGRSGWGPKLVIFQKAANADAALVAAPRVPAFWPNAAWLTSRGFTFRAEPRGEVLATQLRFEPNGRITGYSHPNESAWRIEDGRLLILRRDGVPSCIAVPTHNADGTTSLVGPFIGAPDAIHHFDEIPSESTLPEVCSFDLFDTLVARRCYDPIAIFRAVEAKSGVHDFARLRQTLEAQLWHNGDYDLDDIYRTLGKATGWPEPLLGRLRMLELAEEWDNLFPIAEMVARVGPNDMIVSDMYLPLSFVRRLVDEICGLPGRPIHLSSHGKRRGEAWPKLLATHRIRQHHGDNADSDVEGARRAGINAEHITLSQWTRGEQILRDTGLQEFANALREARLAYRAPDLLHADGAKAQFEINLPLLILASLDVLQRAAAETVDTLLMCARDCNLWLHLMQFLAPRSPAAPAVRYLLSSRVLLLSSSADYLAYFDRMAGPRSMAVDVSGTGRSHAHFIGTSGKQHNTSVYLLAASDDVTKVMHELAPARSDVAVQMLSGPLGIERAFVESLNMSLEGRASRVHFTGQNFVPVFDPNEFGLPARASISAMRAAFLSGLAVIQRDIRKLPNDIPMEVLRAAAAALIAQAADFQSLTAPILNDILREEQTIVAAARAERQRNMALDDASKT